VAAGGMTGDHHLGQLGEHSAVGESGQNRIQRIERAGGDGAVRGLAGRPVVGRPMQHLRAQMIGRDVLIGEELGRQHQGGGTGGQVVQRYAVAGRGEAALTAIGVHVRYVVANPSSYAYFTPDRPLPGGGFGRFAGAAACPAFDQWKYGFAGGLPPYLQGTAANLEQRYAARDVVMLLGGADNDPQLKVLDKSCSGEAEGTDHLSRGLAYAAYLRARGHAAAPFVIPGVGHDGGRMFGSACGLAALFDRPGCATP
jgi:hypothetical protein